MLLGHKKNVTTNVYPSYFKTRFKTFYFFKINHKSNGKRALTQKEFHTDGQGGRPLDPPLHQGHQSRPVQPGRQQAGARTTVHHKQLARVGIDDNVGGSVQQPRAQDGRNGAAVNVHCRYGRCGIVNPGEDQRKII